MPEGTGEEKGVGKGRTDGMTFEEVKECRDVILKNPLFSGMDDTELTESLRLLSAFVSTYRRDERLHAPYTRLERFGLVLRGSLKVCCDDIDGGRMLMADVQPGVTFGESLCFLGIVDSPAYIYASVDTAVLWLSDAALHTAGGTGDDPGTDRAEKTGNPGNPAFLPALRERFTSLLCHRTLSMNSRIQTLTKLSLREKLLFFLSQAAREAFTRRSGGGRSQSVLSRPFDISMSRDDLASYIGANRTAVSRELSNMKKDGLIDYAGSTFRLLGHDKEVL